MLVQSCRTVDTYTDNEDGSDDANDGNGSSLTPVFPKDIQVVLDMSGKKPVSVLHLRHHHWQCVGGDQPLRKSV